MQINKNNTLVCLFVTTKKLHQHKCCIFHTFYTNYRNNLVKNISPFETIKQDGATHESLRNANEY